MLVIYLPEAEFKQKKPLEVEGLFSRGLSSSEEWRWPVGRR